MNVALPTVTDSFLAGAEQYDWPGNVRELERKVTRLLLSYRGGKLDGSSIEGFLNSGRRTASRVQAPRLPIPAPDGPWNPSRAEEAILREERADVIGMARALLADPDLPRKWLAGEDAAARECVFCPFCEREDQQHRVVACTLWPKDPSDHRARLTPSVWRLGESVR